MENARQVRRGLDDKRVLGIYTESATDHEKETKMNDIERRNRAIRKHFYGLLGKGIPIMTAYAMIGQEFYLGEERIRQIVAKRNC